MTANDEKNKHNVDCFAGNYPDGIGHLDTCDTDRITDLDVYATD